MCGLPFSFLVPFVFFFLWMLMSERRWGSCCTSSDGKQNNRNSNISFPVRRDNQISHFFKLRYRVGWASRVRGLGISAPASCTSLNNFHHGLARKARWHGWDACVRVVECVQLVLCLIAVFSTQQYPACSMLAYYWCVRTGRVRFVPRHACMGRRIEREYILINSY